MRDRGGDLESVGFLKRVGTEQGESLHVVKRNEKKKKKTTRISALRRPSEVSK